MLGGKIQNDNPNKGTDSPGLASRFIALVDNHRNGPRLVLAFAFLVITATWASIGLHVHDQHRSIFESAERELVGAVITLDSHTRRTVEAVNTTLRSVDSWLYETSLRARPAPLADVASLISDLQSKNEDPVDIRPIGPDGFLFRFDRSGGDFRAFVGDREYIKALEHARAGSLYISTPVFSRDSKRYVLPIAIKAHVNRHGVAYLVAAVTVRQFETAYKDLLISAPARIGIVRDTGEVLVTVPNDPELIGKKMPGFSLVAQTRPNVLRGTADLPSSVPGNTAMTAFAHLARQPLIVFAAFDREDLQKGWLTLAMPQIAAGIVATLLTLLIAGWLRHLLSLKEKEADNVRAALEEAKAANIAKRQFMANMSHELRTPLNAILGFSEVIAGAVFGPLEAQYRTYGGDIHKSGQHLLHLVDQLLDISRIESGTMALNFQPCDLHDIVSEALKVTRPVAVDLNLRLSVQLEDDARQLVTDRGVLRQIMINLLSNAAKYNKQDGSITVTSRRTDSGICLVVEDTGYGIPTADLNRVFEPFARGDAWVARSTVEGTGLGLPIVRRLMERIGGEITLTSREGVGTRVELFLPHRVEELTRVG